MRCRPQAPAGVEEGAQRSPLCHSRPTCPRNLPEPPTWSPGAAPARRRLRLSGRSARGRRAPAPQSDAEVMAAADCWCLISPRGEEGETGHRCRPEPDIMTRNARQTPRRVRRGKVEGGERELGAPPQTPALLGDGGDLAKGAGRYGEGGHLLAGHHTGCQTVRPRSSRPVTAGQPAREERRPGHMEHAKDDLTPSYRPGMAPPARRGDDHTAPPFVHG